jgi:Domain of unknown function (DUF4345)
MSNQLSTSQTIVRTCLYLLGMIALLGGAMQMYLGEPETTARLDNVHRFMAGVYFSSGLIAMYAARTIRTQSTLIYLLALAAFLGGTGRLISMSIVGIPEPHALWLGYLTPELLLPIVMAIAQRTTDKAQQVQ